jgi:type II secretory pathway pseudopilin PulG
MMNFKKGLVALAVVAAVGAAASPSYAQSQDGGVRISAQRAQALHACSVRAARLHGRTWPT